MSLFLGSANETGVIVAVPADDYKLAMSIAEPTLVMPRGGTVARRSGVTVYSVIRFVCSASYDVDARAHGRARQGQHDEVHVFFFFFFFFFFFWKGAAVRLSVCNCHWFVFLSAVVAT